MTYEEISHFTIANLKGLTYGDIEKPVYQLLEEYGESKIALTPSALEKLRALDPKAVLMIPIVSV
ncbi:hypothetical protein SAMN02745687_00945 [Lachnospiraceae bacterium NK3A20]|nr:hypothetical protein SAMN02745687_00945 [Lachnospiraceae bacterium NK3A20]